MTSPLTTEQEGEGFAFFRWHTIQYDGPAWVNHPHPGYEQTECRRLFRKLNPQTTTETHRG